MQNDKLIFDDKFKCWIGYGVILLIFVLFFGWSAIAQLSSAAVAEGVITVDGRSHNIEHLEGGMVEAIYIDDGDFVKKGQDLLSLDDTQARAQLEIIHSRLLTLLAEEARLLAERDEKTQVDFSSLYAQPFFSHAGKYIVQNQQHIFSSRQQGRQKERQLQLKTIEQLQSKIKGLEALKRSRQKVAQSFMDEAADHRSLTERGLMAKQRLLELERQASEMEGNVAEQTAMIATTRLQIAEVEQQILLSENKFHEEVVTTLRETQSQLYDLKERLRAVQDMVLRTRIQSPGDGVVMGLGVHTIGEVIAPGHQILTIVPQQATLIVESKVLPIDIDDVRIGLQADVRLSAYAFRTTPVVEGEVIHVSADKITEERSGQQYYLAKIKLNEEQLAALENIKLVPGMPAEVMIKTGQRTLLTYLLQPLTDALARSFKET